MIKSTVRFCVFSWLILRLQWAQNGLANAEHSCLVNSVCCHSLEYQNHSCQSKRVWPHVPTFSWCIQIMGTKSVCLSVCVRNLNPALWGFCKYCAIVGICNTSRIHPFDLFIHPIPSIHPSYILQFKRLGSVRCIDWLSFPQGSVFSKFDLSVQMYYWLFQCDLGNGIDPFTEINHTNNNLFTFRFLLTHWLNYLIIVVKRSSGLSVTISEKYAGLKRED